MIGTLYIIISAGFLAILYGYIVSKQILSASPGNEKMKEIANAIQVGASPTQIPKAYVIIIRIIIPTMAIVLY